MKIVILSGGFSEEQHTSRKTAEHVAKALDKLGHTPVMIEYDHRFADNIIKQSPDVVFPIVQGRHHGDGAVQAVLELIGIPYVGSRPGAAAIINNKTLCKKVWQAAGLRTPRFFEFSYEEHKTGGFNDFCDKAEAVGLTLPVVVKPPTQGNRYGMTFVKDAHTYPAIENAFKYDGTLLAERYVPGRFITQGIIEVEGKMTAMPPIEVFDPTEAEFKKYDGDTVARDHGLTAEQLAEINRTSLAAAMCTGATSHARIDYHLSAGELFLLEINAVPGLIPGYSDMIKCSDAAGYDYAVFIGMILATAGRG